ncbi:MAG: AraC family transcriptional regulator [Chryseobacterium sp.]|nr:MAG: AraC family transcriptional regulator [Chryseobacterium sp.]
MAHTNPLRIKTITEAHRILGLPSPGHPLISVVEYSALQTLATDPSNNGLIFDFYFISLKKGVCDKLHYGQHTYDFDDGVMIFVAPGQILRSGGTGPEDNLSGWILLVQPDLLWKTSLANTARNYEFFDYSANEALFLSDKEETIINGIVQNIRQEYQSNIDRYSKQIIVSHIENLLSYAERFYSRQFFTREKANHQIIERLEKIVADYFNSGNLVTKGLPEVQSISKELNLSVSYLSRLLKTLTGQSTQQFIHDKLIEKAKQKLSTTDLTVSEIAYELGFEHPQSFSKLFKTKTRLSPLAFRQSFN